ncbi:MULTISPECIES: tRNA(Met) cytidine acetyltransferase TmcA [unclassified Mannheimia]|uniref:tRNA(Met) cytidine acetyltransferase TmcA n=1 Tax=unclassified Mannheimia TaxID=2645054 RepID=UPI00359DF324
MRKLVIVNDQNKKLVQYVPKFVSSGIYLPSAIYPIHFSNAKSLLGNEYPFAIYDMRAENGVNFNLEAFGILAGTIQENGTLYLLCPDWENIENIIDLDSLRWNDGKAVTAPNFYHYFKQLVTQYQFESRGELHSPFSYPSSKDECNSPLRLTNEQQKILKNLPLDNPDIHLITAPRGRGKSTLAGLLATELTQQHNVLITARSLSALPSFWRSAEQKIPFFAPDHLTELVKSKKISPNQWLFIDEAASLPLPILHTLCAYFEKVVLTTTTQNYEGTGRGFELKLPKMLNKLFKHWTLSQPLRWGENDPLEHFINDLLLLNGYTVGENCNFPLQSVEVALIQRRIEFYRLLANAHYKTTPTDLRRLFDGENQILLQEIENDQLIGGIWAMLEGGLSEELTHAIWLGERRPQGNLVAQYLCFQGNLPEACKLHSVRISRIAVKPEKQNQGVGKRLISRFILQNSSAKRPLDFISVSFGLTAPLYTFWQSCGFDLVQITPNKEASSGYHSAMMIYPLSEKGKQFAQQATQAFARDFAFQLFFDDVYEELQNVEQFRPLAEKNLADRDWQNLTAFANGKRALSAVYVSLKRLYFSNPEKLISLAVFSKNKQKRSKAETEKYRQIVQTYLKTVNH